MFRKTTSKSPLTRISQMTFVNPNLLLLLATALFTVGLMLSSTQNMSAQDRRGNDEGLQRLLKGTERAKTIARIPAPFVAAIKREYESSPALQKETKFEPYLAHRYFGVMDAVELVEGKFRLPDRRPVTMCTDGTCDGPLNTSVWSGAWTGTQPTDISDANLPIGTWTPGIAPNNGSISDTACGTAASQAHHSIVPNGTDPEISTMRTVAPTPISNGASLRLGNRCPNFGGERVSKTFTVVAGQTTLQFWFAAVFQNPTGHGPAIQPGFGAYLLNGSTPIPNRIDLDPTQAGAQDFIVADMTNPFFGVKPGSTVVVYRDWTCVTVDLKGLEGQTVTLVLANRDCGAGAHWGYTYVDSFCLGCAGNATGDATFNPGKSDCAKGQICFDYTVPKLPNGTTGQVNLSLGLYQNGVLVNTLTSGPLTTSGTYCFSTLAAGLNQSAGGFDWQATANFTITGATIAPIVIGSRGDGFVTGTNNDCRFPPKPIDPCCPPWNKDLLKDTMFYHGSGSISAPYTMHFQSNTSLNTQLQTYLNYMNSLNPAITQLIIDWELRDGNTYPIPGAVISNPAATTWNYPGSGNFAITGDANFFSQSTNSFPMQVGNWYYVSARIHLPRGQTFFSEKCSPVSMWVRLQVIGAKGRAGSQPAVLEISDGQRIIQQVPIEQRRAGPINRRNN